MICGTTVPYITALPSFFAVSTLTFCARPCDGTRSEAGTIPISRPNRIIDRRLKHPMSNLLLLTRTFRERRRAKQIRKALNRQFLEPCARLACAPPAFPWAARSADRAHLL